MSNKSSLPEDARITAALKRSLELGETGIAVAAYYRGKRVVDAVTGTLSETGSDPVTKETLFPVFSITKGVTALAMHMQADRGLLHMNDPVSKHWPEFGANGKSYVTMEGALSHRAGIAQMPPGVTPERMADWTGWSSTLPSRSQSSHLESPMRTTYLYGAGSLAK